jgi:uncharacterized membrane protein YcjF (UPF0283 family)
MNKKAQTQLQGMTKPNQQPGIQAGAVGAGVTKGIGTANTGAVNQPDKKKSKLWIWLVIVLVVLIGIAIGTWFLLKG